MSHGHRGLQNAIAISLICSTQPEHLQAARNVLGYESCVAWTCKGVEQKFSRTTFRVNCMHNMKQGPVKSDSTVVQGPRFTSAEVPALIFFAPSKQQWVIVCFL